MKRLKTKLVATIMLSLTLTQTVFGASSIYYKEPYFISNRFSIKPHFNIGEGKQVVSNRFSIKPAFNSGLTKYFYSGVIAVLDMPDVNFMVDGNVLKTGVKVKDTSKISLNIDYSTCSIKDSISSVEYYVENITDGAVSSKEGVTIKDYVVDSPLNIVLENEKVYKLGQITTFTDGMKYETKSIEFKVNEKGLVEFLSPKGNKLYEEYITTQFTISKELNMNTFNLYLQKEDNTRIKVGDNLSVSDTKVSETDKETVHEFRYKLPEGIKKFNHVLEKVN